jgi:hypothetical protein
MLCFQRKYYSNIVEPMIKINKKFRSVFYFIFFLIPKLLFSQTSFQGKVIDSETRMPIAYIYIYIAKVPTKNTYSDSSGNFHIEKMSKNDSIVFSCVGYTKKTVSIESLSSKSVIELTPYIHLLEEIVVRAKEKKTTYIGSPKKIFSSYSACNSTRIGFIFLNLLSIPSSYNSMTISKIEIFLSKEGDAPLRLRIMSKDEKTLKPKNNLLNQSIIFRPYKKGWNTFELEEPIFIKASELFIGVEILANSNRNISQCLGYVRSNKKSVFGIESVNNWTPIAFSKKTELMLRAAVKFY